MKFFSKETFVNMTRAKVFILTIYSTLYRAKIRFVFKMDFSSSFLPPAPPWSPHHQGHVTCHEPRHAVCHGDPAWPPCPRVRTVWIPAGGCGNCPGGGDNVVLTQDCDVTSDYQGEQALECAECVRRGSRGGQCGGGHQDQGGRGGDTQHGHWQTVCTGGQHQVRSSLQEWQELVMSLL